ncbi:hypothetical protein Syun_021121 [Stephania yunnanensis]|uniref:Uncharacterized protein n=1 Tax=Stephania yunnanensis TaxID=152371 RepID=A0AAP0NQF3_9MAGN
MVFGNLVSQNPNSNAHWVANRETPHPKSPSGALVINKNGHLSLFNQTHHVIRSSNGGSASGGAKNPISYDYPSDTLLDGMKMGWDLGTRLNRKLTSWKSLSDPSMGDFIYGLDRHGLPEMVLRNGSAKLFRTGSWNGFHFSGTPEVKNNSIFKPIFVSNV